MNPGVTLVLDVIGDDHETFTNVHSHMYNTTRVFTLNIQEYLMDQITAFMKNENDDPSHEETNNITIRVISYFSLVEKNMTFAAQKLITSSGRTTVKRLDHSQCIIIHILKLF